MNNNRKLKNPIMKNLLYFLTFIGVLISCSSNDEETKKKIIIEEVSLSNSETFTYSLGYFNIEEGAFIQKEPENSEISEIIPDDAQGNLIYHYKARENYEGKDYVEIRTGRGSDGASTSTKIEVIKITFKITD